MLKDQRDITRVQHPERSGSAVEFSKRIQAAQMDKTCRKFTSHEEARAETYGYWYTRPNSEIFEETWKMSRDAYREWYRMKGIVPHGEEPARSFTRIQRILAFNEQSVRYLVVGGYALVRYAEPRVTKDLDIFRT